MTTELYDSSGCGCCGEKTEFPLVVSNRPALSSIRYRIGEYSDFKRDLLSGISGKHILKSLSSRDTRDYSVAVLDLWAYLADILTFYQERIANEAFLRTATLRESVLKLAGLIDYRLGPGAAATAFLAFTVEKGKTLTIPKGLRVQSVPGQNEKPQKFELIEDLAADALLNVHSTYPKPSAFNPFARGNLRASLPPGVPADATKPLVRGEKALLFTDRVLERKELVSVANEERETLLQWTPAVQTAGLEMPLANMTTYEREFAVFGSNAPPSYMKASEDPTSQGGFRWSLTSLTDDYYIDMSQNPEIPLAQKVENLKAGTALIVAVAPEDAATPARIRLATVAAAEARPATIGQLTDVVTHVKLGVAAAGTPTVTLDGSNRICVFVIADDGAVWYRHQDSSDPLKLYSDWETLGGNWTQLTAQIGSSGPVNLFGLDPEGRAWSILQSSSGKWGQWKELGVEGERIVAARRPGAAGGIGLFARGRSGDVKFREQISGGTWSEWKSLGGDVEEMVGEANQNGAFELFAVARNGRLLHNRQAGLYGAWQGWQTMGQWADLVCVGRNKDGRLEVFIRGRDKALWHIKQKVVNGNAWMDWKKLGGSIVVDQLAVTTGKDGCLKLFGRDKDGALQRRFQTSAGSDSYAPWYRVRKSPINGLAAAVDGISEAVAFYRSTDGSIGCYGFVSKKDQTGSLGLPIWSAIDRRRVTVYELSRPPLPLRTQQFAETIAGNEVTLSTSSITALPEGRRILLDDSRQEPHLATVVSAAVSGESLVVTFQPPLDRPLDTRTAVLYANVGKSTHGETVKNEILGSGDGSTRFLSFALKKSPVTYVPKPGAPNGVESTLEVRIDAIRWHELPSLLGAASDDRVYTTTIDDHGKTTVRFGGEPGARVPTGRNNITATYRQGLGPDGNVKSRSLTTLLDRPVGLKSVTNPGPAEGGAPPETLDQARLNAPAKVKTFGRIVSLRDFEDAARELAVVAKASASVDWDGEEQAVIVTVAGAGGTPLTAVLKDIAADLDLRRDINRRMHVRPHKDLRVAVSMNVLADPDHTVEAVTARVKSALQSFFAFENRELGQPVFESDIYRLVQSQDGVLAVDLDVLRSSGTQGTPDLGDIPVPFDSIATLDLDATVVAVRHGGL